MRETLRPTVNSACATAQMVKSTLTSCPFHTPPSRCKPSTISIRFPYLYTNLRNWKPYRLQEWDLGRQKTRRRLQELYHILQRTVFCTQTREEHAFNSPSVLASADCPSLQALPRQVAHPSAATPCFQPCLAPEAVLSPWQRRSSGHHHFNTGRRSGRRHSGGTASDRRDREGLRVTATQRVCNSWTLSGK